MDQNLLVKNISSPKYVQIEPVGQCNLRCKMCSIQFRHDGPPYGPPAFMDFDLYTRLVDQFTNMETLHLQGLGEPMMHPRYFDMVKYAVNRGVRVTTNTNLTLLNPSRAEACITSGLDGLYVSIDGATAKTYEAIRTRAHFDRVLNNLQMMVQTRRKMNSELPHMKMVMVIMRQNLEELPDLVRLAYRYEMQDVFVQHLSHDFGEGTLPDQYRPMRDFVEDETLLLEDEQRVAEFFNKARETASSLGVKIRLPKVRMTPHPIGTPGPDRCSWPFTSGYISYDGYAMPCCMVSTPDRINFGNLKEQSVEEVWSGQAYQAFRDELSSETPPSICQSCSIYKGTF